MAGTPADLTVNKDNSPTHDRTFYGNGCPNGWGDKGAGGSITPCSTRIVKTYDNEDQKNGTYYHFQAATSGTGGSMSTDNTNSSDTFCPLGWQLPYSGTGGDYYNKSRSWNYLFNKYSIIDDETSATKVKSYPFSYVYSGIFGWDMGRLYYQNGGGFYGSSTLASSGQLYRLNTATMRVNMAENVTKLHAGALRCVDYSSDLSSTARWQERLRI